eukprot:1699384-Pyramimonas_sp.AAC.1
MMDLANEVEAELPNRVVVRPAPTFSSQSNPSENANGIAQEQSARAGARWRRDYEPGSDQVRPCTSGSNATRAGHAPT